MPASEAPAEIEKNRLMKVGVVVHHVASVYPLEIQLAQTLAGGKPLTGVTMDDVDAMNAAHAKE